VSKRLSTPYRSGPGAADRMVIGEVNAEATASSEPTTSRARPCEAPLTSQLRSHAHPVQARPDIAGVAGVAGAPGIAGARAAPSPDLGGVIVSLGSPFSSMASARALNAVPHP
jgi:hypothetical protein